MKRNISFFQMIDFIIFGWIINWDYPTYYRPRYHYMLYSTVFFHYLIPQKIFRINGNVPWPVHFTSSVKGHKNIQKGIICDPGDNPGIYIQANCGLQIGSNVGFGAGTKIITSNHAHEDHSKHEFSEPIRIGNNVFVGANSVLLPGVTIGDNVVIGAGSIVSKNIPENSIALGNPCMVVKQKSPYREDLSQITFNKKIMHLSY